MASPKIETVRDLSQRYCNWGKWPALRVRRPDGRLLPILLPAERRRVEEELALSCRPREIRAAGLRGLGECRRSRLELIRSEGGPFPLVALTLKMPWSFLCPSSRAIWWSPFSYSLPLRPTP